MQVKVVLDYISNTTLFSQTITTFETNVPSMLVK